MFDHPTITALVAHLTASLASDTGALPAVGAAAGTVSSTDGPAGAALTLQQVMLGRGMPKGCTSLQSRNAQHERKHSMWLELLQSCARSSTCQPTASWLQGFC